MTAQDVAEALRALIATGKIPGFEDYGADFVEMDSSGSSLAGPDGKLFTISVKEGI